MSQMQYSQAMHGFCVNASTPKDADGWVVLEKVEYTQTTRPPDPDESHHPMVLPVLKTKKKGIQITWFFKGHGVGSDVELNFDDLMGYQRDAIVNSIRDFSEHLNPGFEAVSLTAPSYYKTFDFDSRHPDEIKTILGR